LFQAFGIDGKDITWDTWVDTIELTASRPNSFFFSFHNFLSFVSPSILALWGFLNSILHMYYIDSTLRIDASVPCAL
jgi:hypothetical protein